MRTRSIRRSRPRAVWAAFATGAVLCVLVVAAVLLPILGLIGAADATTVGTLNVPVGSIVLAIAVTFLLALGLLAAAFVSRNGALAWIAAVAAVISVLAGSLWPMAATALASVDQAQDLIPFVQDVIGQVTGR